MKGYRQPTTARSAPLVSVLVIGLMLVIGGCGDDGASIRNEQMTQEEALAKLEAEPTEDGVNHEYQASPGKSCEVENVLVGQQTIEFWVDAGEANVLDLGNGIGIDFVAASEKDQDCIDIAKQRLG